MLLTMASFADQVVVISVSFLVILFSAQKYGTSKLGLVLGPALLLWFFCLAGIGIYNLVKYDSSVFKAFNPAYIYFFFKRNSVNAWYALGGCVLCATGKFHILGYILKSLNILNDFLTKSHCSFLYMWISGSEAMFADLSYFSVHSVQVG